MKIKEIILGGKFVSLVPLRLEHLDTLYEIGLDKSLWFWTVNVIKNLDDMRCYVETALDEFERKVSLPFVTIEKSSGKIVGSTRFGNIDTKNRKVEIGWTWINPRWQRTFINTEAKLLMLAHAFETWNCIRVELKTDVLNEKSRNAILRIGAKEEGILRQHVITDAGRFRDSVYFSIIDSEWREVKANLEKKLRSF
ncbi:MAG: GNAT family N-acetyltransferase [Acidobacteria bacterium]|jgi:RimJ/RimL family protein N-acetyltransferase|nr:GNAT family N-acetyltransferase [Acidobacteriota bacterium]